MAQELINIGAVADDGTGDTIRGAGIKINNNFTEVYAQPNFSLSQLSFDATLSVPRSPTLISNLRAMAPVQCRSVTSQ